MSAPIKTTCPYCGVGCGLLAQPDGERWQVRGDPEHPANLGRLCSKGAALADTLGLETRLLHPVVDGRQASWGDAVAATAMRIQSAIDRHGPDSFAFYLSGQLLTEDYYVANKLATGWLGTANDDTNSRLCMSATVAGHRRAFGSDTVPVCYEDLELADLVVLVGSNLAWCHPVLFQRLRAAREKRGVRVVLIDPRRTDCADIADLYIPIEPGGDVALFNGLLAHLDAAGKIDTAYVGAHVSGFAATLAAARADAPPHSEDIARFYDWFAASERTVTVFSQGVNQSSSGVDKVNAIINVHLATGRIGRPGAGPFSVTGQPNAMGGREVGGLANQLAAHMGFDPASINLVRRFWDAPRMAPAEGLKAVDMFRAIDDGRIKAVWIMGTNPAVSLPESDLVRRALARCPTVIVSDCVADTDTLRYAHIRLPALAWGEKSGTVTNSDRTVSRQRPFLPPPGEAKADWRALKMVADALGFGPAFAWTGPAEIFREHAALSLFENDGRRDFALTAQASVDYETLAPAPWGAKRMFADGRFFTADGRARMVPVRHRPPVETPSAAFPYRLNSGRYRDQWHTMTRTGLAPKLCGHRSEPLVDIHPDDAAAAGLGDGALVCVESRLGAMIARVNPTAAQRPGDLFVPMHWSDRFASLGLVGRLIPGHVDPLSGQPESKHVPVRLSPFTPSWRGVLIGDGRPQPSGVDWWTRHQAEGATVTELGGGDRSRLVQALTDAYGEERIELIDPGRGAARYAWLRDGRLVAALFLAPERPEIGTAWVAGLVGRLLAAPSERAAALAGTAPAGQAEDGPIVCACFSVGLAAIRRAVTERRLTTVAEIGAALKAGSGCGSCIPELHRIVAASSALQTAA